MGGQLELAFLKGIGGREARETLLNSTDHHGNARRGPARQHYARVRATRPPSGQGQAGGRRWAGRGNPARAARPLPKGPELLPAVLPPGLAGPTPLTPV